MPVSRMRMRPWLEDKINSNTITGLVWVDKERKMFSIPWKHAARHGWVMDKDACLFKQWAVHTGKFRDGETKPDAKTWKANFRCAMNSLPDIQEVKDKSVNKGNQAVRVYKMLHIPSKPHNKKSKAKDTKKNNKRSMIKMEEVNYSDSQCDESDMQEDSTTQESTVDSTEDLGLSESTYVNDSDVPDWSTSVEIGPDSTNNIYASFQVSPDHTPDYDLDTEAIIEITQQLEQDTTQWMQNGMNSKGFLSNEVGTAESYLSSPESQWSNNSGEELELTLYTELSSRPAEDIFSYDYWNTSVPASYNHQQIPLFSI